MKISIETALSHLNSGRVVALPTETVYGLAASLAFPEAIAQIFELKGRPLSNPLIIHIADHAQIEPLITLQPPRFSELSQAFWPGAMTLILDVDEEKIPSLVRAGLPTAAFRMPNHPFTLELIKGAGPLVMPSANLSGRPSATLPHHVESDFGIEFPLVDGGQSGYGVESTILMHREGIWKIIRQGALPPQAFTAILGYQPPLSNCHPEEKPLCPGQLFRHYSPKAKLLPLTHLELLLQGEGAILLGFSDRTYPKGIELISLGSSCDPEEIAKNLYASLRLLDERNIASAWVDLTLPTAGLWATIGERLSRAALAETFNQ